MPSVRRRKRRRKTRIPTRRVDEKLAIWARHRNPVGHKFYGKAKKDGEWKHFEFSVITERSLPKKALYHCVRETMRMMSKKKKLPPKHYYHAYDGFMHLLGYDWVQMEDVICDYKHTAT